MATTLRAALAALAPGQRLVNAGGYTCLPTMVLAELDAPTLRIGPPDADGIREIQLHDHTAWGTISEDGEHYEVRNAETDEDLNAVGTALDEATPHEIVLAMRRHADGGAVTLTGPAGESGGIWEALGDRVPGEQIYRFG